MPFINDQIISADLVAVKAKLEATYGIPETLLTADGVMLSNFKLNHINATHEDSNVVTGTGGNSKKYLNYVMAEATFDIELGRATGSATAIPAVGSFLRVAGWDEFIESDHIRYQMAADVALQDSLTFETQIDDRNILLKGVKGSSSVKYFEDKRIIVSFKVVCNYSEPTVGVFTRVDYSKFARSLLVNPDNVTLCTQKGSDVVTHSIEFDVGAKVERIPSVNQELVAHLELSPTLKSSIRMPKLAQWNIEQDITNEVEGWVKWSVGGAAGSIVEMDVYAQYLGLELTDDTPRKANITHHPIPDAATTGAVIRFK